jgi:hypothetical protein
MEITRLSPDINICTPKQTAKAISEEKLFINSLLMKHEALVSSRTYMRTRHTHKKT